MTCWNNNVESKWILKDDVISSYGVTEPSFYKIGQDVKQNGDKLEFIVDLKFFEVYLNFEEKTASLAGMPFSCY